jgi:hypothetical protein
MRGESDVNFPIHSGKLQQQAGGLAVVVSLLWAVGIYWFQSWSWASAFAMILPASIALVFLFRPAVTQGELQWNASQWYFLWANNQRQPVKQAISLQVHIDFQNFLLLKISPINTEADSSQLKPCWLWVESRFDPQSWIPFRRAVYCKSPSAQAEPIRGRN